MLTALKIKSPSYLVACFSTAPYFRPTPSRAVYKPLKNLHESYSTTPSARITYTEKALEIRQS